MRFVVWSVARSENQIKQNMLSVDPKSDGLELYFKSNGSETVNGNKIKDSARYRVYHRWS